MDICMPGIDGIEIMKQILSNWYGDNELITPSHCTNLNEKEKPYTVSIK